MPATETATALPEEAELAIQNGRRPLLPECVEMVAPVTIAGGDEGLSEDLAAAVREHSAGVADFVEKANELSEIGADSVRAYLDEFDQGVPTSESVPTLLEAADERRSLAFHLVEQATRLNRDAAGLAESATEERRELQKVAQKTFEETKNTVYDELRQVGQPVRNPDLLDNKRVKAAKAAADAQHALAIALNKQAGQFRRAATQAHALLSKMAEWAVA